MNRTWVKWVFGFAGAIVVGALGSGLWDVVVKPGSQWAGRGVLDVVTFGSVALKDDIYRDAAKGYHEEAVIKMFQLGLGFFTGAFTSFAFLTVVLRGRFARWLGLSRETEADSQTTGHHMASAYKNRARRALRILYAFELVVSLALVFILVGLLKTSQANTAYTFYAQSMTICRPYMDEHEAQLLASRFAGLQGRADYLAVIDELRRVAASNQRTLPEFEPW